jgi:beta-galactosidase
MPVEDTIGALLESEEGYSPRHAALVRRVLLSAQRRGVANLTLGDKLRMLWCMLRYHNTSQDGVELYGKYVSNWGGSSTVWRFDAIRDGQVVSTITRCPDTRLHLAVQVSHTHLVEDVSYDMAAIRIRILDGNDACAPYAQLPLHFTVRGDAALVGPDTVCAEGGMTGTYLRTLGRAGQAELTISSPQLDSVTISFTIEQRKDDTP